MNTKPWLILMATALLVVTPFSLGMTQDLDDPLDELLLDVETDDEEELLSVLKTAVEYEDLETLLELLHKSGLDKKLKGEGPFTLLAPDDSAFAQLRPDQLERLFSDKEHLQDVISRHIIVGHRMKFGDEPEELTIKVLGGDVVEVEVTDESVRIGEAWIVDEEIECSNGVIHVIDGVLLPPKGQRKD